MLHINISRLLSLVTVLVILTLVAWPMLVAAQEPEPGPGDVPTSYLAVQNSIIIPPELAPDLEFRPIKGHVECGRFWTKQGQGAPMAYLKIGAAPNYPQGWVMADNRTFVCLDKAGKLVGLELRDPQEPLKFLAPVLYEQQVGIIVLPPTRGTVRAAMWTYAWFYRQLATQPTATLVPTVTVSPTPKLTATRTSAPLLPSVPTPTWMPSPTVTSASSPTPIPSPTPAPKCLVGIDYGRLADKVVNDPVFGAAVAFTVAGQQDFQELTALAAYEGGWDAGIKDVTIDDGIIAVEYGDGLIVTSDIRGPAGPEGQLSQTAQVLLAVAVLAAALLATWALLAVMKIRRTSFLVGGKFESGKLYLLDNRGRKHSIGELGKDGVGIQAIWLERGHLRVQMTDQHEFDLGLVTPDPHATAMLLHNHADFISAVAAALRWELKELKPGLLEGLDTKCVRRLKEAGIFTVADLARADQNYVRRLLPESAKPRACAWTARARQMSKSN